MVLSLSDQSNQSLCDDACTLHPSIHPYIQATTHPYKNKTCLLKSHCMWASEVYQQVKALAANLDNLSLILEPTWLMERKDSGNLPSDLCMHAGASARGHTHLRCCSYVSFGRMGLMYVHSLLYWQYMLICPCSVVDTGLCSWLVSCVIGFTGVKSEGF